MLLKKIFAFLLLSSPFFILYFSKTLKAMEDPPLIFSYQLGTAGESPTPTPKNLKDEIKKVLYEHNDKILHLKETLKIQASSKERINPLLALLLILKHETTWGSYRYLKILIENIKEFKDFLLFDELKEILYKLLTYTTEINRADISNYILKTYESIFQDSIFNKHHADNYQLFKRLLTNQNDEILQNFIQNKILNFTYHLKKLKKTAQENQLSELEKVLSIKIWCNRALNIVHILILGSFIIILSYLAQTIH